MSETFEGQYKSIYKNAVELAYFSKGSMSLDSAMSKTPIEKEIILEFINERLEVELKKPPHQNY